MPASHCKYPQHHSGPSAGPPIGLLAAIGVAACVIGLWHSIVLILVCVALLAVLAGCVFLLIHAGHQPPYDAAERYQERRDAAYTTEVLPRAADARTAELEAENAALRRQLEAPAVHQHLHLHGIGGDDMAAIAHKALQTPDYR